MDEAEGLGTSEASPAPAAIPSWAVKEDDRARREADLDQAQGLHFVWILIIYGAAPVLIALGGLVWRLLK